MQVFRDVLTECNLDDLGFVGDPFTWRRGRIRECPDRAIANPAWLVMHPEATVQHLESMRSDHRPILLETERPIVSGASGSKKFEAKWLKEDSFRDVVEEAWAKANVEVSEGSVLARLSHMHSSLHAWYRDILQKPKRQLRTAQRKLERAMVGPLSKENEVIAREHAALIELLLEQDKVHWMSELASTRRSEHGFLICPKRIYNL
jgi:hypothetical protein